MNPFNIPEGITGKKEKLVTPSDTAAAFGSGLVPVFATPAMIALMENTAQESVAGYLPAGYTTVGSAVEIKHLRPTPVGMNVRCESLLAEISHPRLVFQVIVSDEQGVIGKGTHTRYLVHQESFLKQAGIS